MKTGPVGHGFNVSRFVDLTKLFVSEFGKFEIGAKSQVASFFRLWKMMEI